MKISLIEKKVISFVKKQGIVKSCDIKNLHLPENYLHLLVKKGVLQKLGRGLYTHAEHTFDAHQSIMEVSKRVPNAVICLLSALRYHEFTTQNPFEIWIAVDIKSWVPKIEYPPIRVFKFSGKAFSQGYSEYKHDGVIVKVYSPAKTIADCFKYRNKIGLDVALEALREGWRYKLFTIDELYKYGKICRVNKVMQPYLDSLI